MYKAFTWYVEYSRCSINGVKIICIKWQRAITVKTRKLRITSRLGYLRICSYLKEMEKKNKNSDHLSYTTGKDARIPAKSVGSVLSTEDTRWIIHVRFSCVKKRVGAQELWNQGKHQGWMSTSQKLQTSEINKMRAHISKLINVFQSTRISNQKAWFRITNSQPASFAPSMTSDKSFNYSKTQLICLKIWLLRRQKSWYSCYYHWLLNNHFPHLPCQENPDFTQV